jgi:hypothetical protein
MTMDRFAAMEAFAKVTRRDDFVAATTEESS